MTSRWTASEPLPQPGSLAPPLLTNCLVCLFFFFFYLPNMREQKPDAGSKQRAKLSFLEAGAVQIFRGFSPPREALFTGDLQVSRTRLLPALFNYNPHKVLAWFFFPLNSQLTATGKLKRFLFSFFPCASTTPTAALTSQRDSRRGSQPLPFTADLCSAVLVFLLLSSSC